MAMYGHFGARFEGVQHSLATIVWCCSEIGSEGQDRFR